MKLNLNVNLSALSKKELEILEYVHDHSDEIVSMSIQQFANNIHYSTSTVLRFCRKLGYSGFSELKFYLRNQLSNEAENKQNDASIETIKKYIISDIESTNSLLNIEDLTSIAKLFSSNKPIYLHSSGGLTGITVDFFANLLFMSGCQKVYKLEASKITSHFIRTLEKENIFVFISNSGNFGTTLNLAKEAKLHGMTLISISSIENNDLAEISDYNLRFFSKQRENEGADLASRLCTFYILSSFIKFYNSYSKGLYHENIS